jgi:hypothetical protein
MKKIILALLTIFAIQSSLQAQVAVQINDSQQNLYERKVVSFNKMKRAGIGLTIGGAVLTGVGTGLLIDYFDKYDNRYYDYGFGNDVEDLDMEYAIGVGLMSIGITAIGGGVTLWSIGAAKSKSYKRKLNSFSFNLSPGYRQQFSLAYRF